MAQQCLDTVEAGDVTTVAVPSLRADRDEPEALLTALADRLRARRRGGLAEPVRPLGRPAVDLPTYAFQRQRYWPDREPARSRARGPRGGAVLGRGRAGRPATTRRHPGAGARRRAEHGPARAVGVAPAPPGPVHRRRLALPGGLAVRCPSAASRSTAPGCSSSPPGTRGRLGSRAPCATAEPRSSSWTRGVATGTPTRSRSGCAVPGTSSASLALATVDAARWSVTLVQALGDAESDRAAVVPHPGRGLRRPRRPADGPGQAQVWGLGRVAALEHPHALGRPDRPARRRWTTRAATRLARRAGRPRGEDQVAVRGSGRLRPPPAPRAPPAPDRRRLDARAARCWSPAAPARSARRSPAGSPRAAPGTSC